MTYFYDFHVAYAFGAAFRSGDSLYPYIFLKNYFSSPWWNEGEYPLGMIWFPTGLLYLQILAAVPFRVSLAVHTLFSLFLFIRTLLLIGQDFRIKPFVVVTCGMLFTPTLMNLAMGQISLLLFSVGFLSYHYARRGRVFAAGALLSLAMVNTHECALFFLLCLAHPEARRIRLLNGFLLSLFAQLSLLWVQRPHILEEYVLFAQNSVPQHMKIITATVPALIHRVFNVSVGLPLIALMLCVTLVACFRSCSNPSVRFARVIGIGVLMLPYAWIHSLILQLPMYLGIIPKILAGAIGSRVGFLMIGGQIPLAIYFLGDPSNRSWIYIIPALIIAGAHLMIFRSGKQLE